MACTPLSIQTGLFLTTANWSTAPSASGAHGRSVTLSATGLLIESPTGSTFHSKTATSVIKYLFFGDGHLAVLTRSDTTVSVNSVDFSTTNPTENNLFLSSISGGSTDDPVLQPSQGNGNAFLIYAADGAGALAQLRHTAIRRSTTGAMLCVGPLPFHPTGQTLGEASSIELIIHYSSGSASHTTRCPMPEGDCDISPSTLNFTQRVIGGPAGTGTETRSVTIENDGTDCLTIQSISNSAPYSSNFSGPQELAPSDDIDVEITFAPTGIGSFNGVTLNVSRDPANGDSSITCNGSARNAVAAIGFNPASVHFDTHPVGSSHTDSLRIRNDGELDLTVSVAAGAGVYSWGSVSQSLAPTAHVDVPITFVPPSIGTHTANLTVTSNAPDSPHTITITGAGCIAEAAINPQHSGAISFGEVQQGFRSVRHFLVTNNGSGPLSFRARIAGTDAALFGLQLESGSITDLAASRTYTVDPQTPCGPLAFGTGETIVAIGLFANQAPGSISAELIIDNHNAPGAPASWTFPLGATIVQPVDVDAALVLDRSGSMSDMVGSRSKQEACITAGRLFVQLIRPDVQDRITTVKYNNVVNVMQPITLVTTVNQPGIVGQINHTELNPDNSTCIAGGVMVALTQLATPRATPSTSLNKLVLVLTDGKDNTAYLNPADGQYYSLLGGQTRDPNNWFATVNTTALTRPADVKIYAVGIGKTDEIDTGRLSTLAQSTGAYSGIVNQDLTGEHYFDLEKYFTQVFMDAVDLSVIADPVATIHVGETHRIAFEVLRGDVNGLVVVYDKLGLGRLPYYLESPNGEIIDVTAIPAGFQVRHGVTETARFTEFRNPLAEEQRYAGTWHLVIKHEGKLCRDLKDYQNWHVNRLQAEHREHLQFGFVFGDCIDYDQPVDYGFSIGIGSNLRMQAYVTPGVVKVGEPIHLSAAVSEAGLPTTGCNVTVQARAPSGATSHLALYDSGYFDDGEVDDGEYANHFYATHESGGYEFLFRATGYSRDGKPIIREALRSKYVEGNQPIIPPENRPEDDRCCRLLVRLLAVGLVLLFIAVLLLWFRG
ncbi:MAG: choice-of-anchor D domain-containing protein [Gammaproteobacteria bacterium]|nr:choice-of-anchor D domain-containing protein [Gammaproteobacteria bacterium]